MPKALCLTSLVVALLVMVLFLIDLIMRLAGMTSLAPLGGASIAMDIVFVLCGGILAYLSWSTYREQD